MLSQWHECILAPDRDRDGIDSEDARHGADQLAALGPQLVKTCGMTSPYRRYIATETAVSIVINVLISALFMVLVFGRSNDIELWGGHGLAVDFIPQTFMIAAMSVLVPTLLTRQRIKRGVLVRSPGERPPLLANLALRVVVIAVALTVALGAIAVLILDASWTRPLGFWEAFPMKLLYGALVALIATPIGLYIALSE